MGISNLLVGDLPDVVAAADAVTASLDTKLAKMSKEVNDIMSNYFLDPCKMNLLLTDYFNKVNGGLPLSQA